MYIKYVEARAGRFLQFLQKTFAAQETIKLNTSWPSKLFEKKSWTLPSILVSFLRPACDSISG